MKLFEMRAIVDDHGRIALPVEQINAAGLTPGDEVQVTLAVNHEESEKTCPQLVVTPDVLESAEQTCDCREDDVEISLTLPDLLLEAAEIPEESALEIICVPGAIIIKAADILDNLPDELHDLFDMLGIDPGTVREVMRKEGYFV